MSNSKKIYIISIVLIFIAGIFFRAYNFSDWLHFELDQSRDAKVIDLAYEEGAGSLPLLGPRAAGSFLRLGPAFYYFNYVSALVFGNTPSGIAVVVMLFGILTMPIFYLFIREYFNKKISLGLFLVFSTSLFLIIYSRFSWNPNFLPFFIILTFYCLLRTAGSEEKNKGMWLIFSSISLAIATQMHFLAFVSVPIIFALYLAIKRPKIKFIFWALAVASILIIYSPAIANDFMTGGDNIKELTKVAQGKSTEDEHQLWEKVFRNVKENSLGYFLILSGQRGEFPKMDLGNNASVAFNEKNKNYLALGIISGLIYIIGVSLLCRKLFLEKEERKRNFLILNSLWFLVTFGLFIPLSFSISPRFFLVISALPFVFLGLMLEAIQNKLASKKSLVLISIIIAVFTISNLIKTKQRFSQYARAPFENFEIEPDRFLKEKTRVTLEQQYKIVELIKEDYLKNNYPVYFESEPFYERALLYNLGKENITSDNFKNILNKEVYQKANYFLVYGTSSNLDKRLGKYEASYVVENKIEVGTLVLFKMIPKKEAITKIEPEIKIIKNNDGNRAGVPARYRWEEIFKDDEDSEEGLKEL